MSKLDEYKNAVSGHKEMLASFMESAIDLPEK